MRKIVFLTVLIFAVQSLVAQVSNQWRGIHRDGIYYEENLLDKWPEGGPELLWYNDSIPTGYSQPTIGEELIYLTGLVDTIDYLIALDKKGLEQWRTPIGRAWTESFSDSRSTPTLANGKLYVQSGYCYVGCYDAKTGKEIWNIDAFTKFEGKTGIWGYSESLLVVDDKVLVTVGGHKTTVIALNANTGEIIWESKTLNDTTGYSSPILIEENNKKIAINVLANNVFGVDVSNGEILFSHNYSEVDDDRAFALWNSAGASRINTNNPVYFNKEIYVTSGYNHSGVKYKLSDDLSELSVVWTDSVLDVHFGGVVLVDGYIYGSNWINNGNGNWCCINWETGEAMYEHKWNNKGNIIYADSMLYLYDEKRGYIGLVKPNPEKFEVISSFRVPHGKGPHWGHLNIINGVLYVRHGTALMAYNIHE